MLEIQKEGKVPDLCQSDSAFSILLSGCEMCCQVHGDSGLSSFSTKVQPQFQQYLDYCRGIGTPVAALSSITSSGGSTPPLGSTQSAKPTSSQTQVASQSTGATQPSGSTSSSAPTSSTGGLAPTLSGSSSSPGSSITSASATFATATTGSGQRLAMSNIATFSFAVTWLFVFLHA
jgi:hypothetical protein